MGGPDFVGAVRSVLQAPDPLTDVTAIGTVPQNIGHVCNGSEAD